MTPEARLINQALKDARAELGRQERSITPVDLAANEIYDILRKQLFTRMPTGEEISDIASAYGRKLDEAARAETAHRGAEAIADEVAATYPFHPRLKNVVALFKENEQFKQTRGVIELVSRLLKSVWERSDNDVFLIGPQHFDLVDCGSTREIDGNLGNARRDRHRPVGRPAVSARASGRPRSGQRHGGTGGITAADGKSVHSRQCGEGPDPARKWWNAWSHRYANRPSSSVRSRSWTIPPGTCITRLRTGSTSTVRRT